MSDMIIREQRRERNKDTRKRAMQVVHADGITETFYDHEEANVLYDALHNSRKPIDKRTYYLNVDSKTVFLDSVREIIWLFE